MERDGGLPQRSIRQWRTLILGDPNANPPIPGDADALEAVTTFWIRSVQRLYAALLDGESIGDEPSGLRAFTHLLAVVCDVGPASIDPTPLTRVLTLTYRLRIASRGKHGPIERRATDAELAELGDAIEMAVPVLNRISYAWIALQGGDEPDTVAGSKIVPGAETLRVVKLIKQGRSNDDIQASTGKSAQNIRTIRSRLKKGEYDLES